MVHFNQESYALGEGYDAAELCLLQLQQVAKKKVKRNNGGTVADNAFYGGVGMDGATKTLNFRAYEYACHKYMRYFKQPEAMYTRFVHRTTLSDKARRAYFSFLMSDDSPWKEFKNRLETHLPKDYEGDKYEWIYQNGWVWTDLSYPSNLQHSFLVASRMVAEWPKLITQWYHWQKTGLNKALCFLFQDVFHACTGMRNGDNKQIFRINGTSLYDWPFDVCSSTEDAVKNFIHGRLEKNRLTEAYKDNPVYTPVNAIFGDNLCWLYLVRNTKNYLNILYDRYGKKYGMSPIETEKFWREKGIGFSVYDHRTYWTVTEKDILSIIKEEEERLCESSEEEKTSKSA